MKTVIDIPEEIRLALINNIPLSMEQQSICDSYIKGAIINGTPLPEGHGRLIDADAFIAKVNKDRAHSCYIQSWTTDDVLDRLQQDYAPTIIEADTESEDLK